jgi:hypothetical protein
MNGYGMFFVQTSALPWRMHQKVTKHGRFCKQNNELPTKNQVELKDNSIEWVLSNLSLFIFIYYYDLLLLWIGMCPDPSFLQFIFSLFNFIDTF